MLLGITTGLCCCCNGGGKPSCPCHSPKGLTELDPPAPAPGDAVGSPEANIAPAPFPLIGLFACDDGSGPPNTDGLRAGGFIGVGALDAGLCCIMGCGETWENGMAPPFVDGVNGDGMLGIELCAWYDRRRNKGTGAVPPPICCCCAPGPVMKG